MLLRTVPRRRTSRLRQYWQKTFVDVVTTYCNIYDNNALSNSLRNNLFLDDFNSSPGWLLVTGTRGAWWCRYRGYCRSGPGHLSARSRVCAQEWQCKDIHSHIHSHTPMHTPKKVQKQQQQQNAQLTKHDPVVYWSSSCAVFWWPIFRKLGTCSTTDALSARTLLTENICESVQQILQHSPAEKEKKKRKRKKKKKKKKKKRGKNAQLTKHDAFLYWSSSCPMWWWATARKLGGCYSGLFHVGGLLAYDSTDKKHL